ncbi:MAG: UDP-glucose 4-epimerase GalE [Bacillota bacterium]|nr:UDP-glucose 4-epimerase GalE [Bacillota bacterium]
MQTILVTGGTGYIGSHTCVALLEAGYEVVIADNLSNSSAGVINRIKEITGREPLFYKVDVTDAGALKKIFETHQIDTIIHFAAFKAVGESVDKPLVYYCNNLLGTIVLAQCCREYGIKKFVFSSSASVYGEQQPPFKETMELPPPASPYGATKAISERILTDYAKTDPQFCLSLLRYFNPVGAHPSGLIGEAPQGIPTNLLPYITKVAKGELEQLNIFGDDYPTADGTGVRDYIHVMDLAEGHLAAMEKLTPGVQVFNLGTGRGTTVLELVRAFEEATGVKIPYKVVGRRPGDVSAAYADVSKAKKELGWQAKRGLKEMCRDAWGFEQGNKD